jgi:hypothetical protein
MAVRAPVCVRVRACLRVYVPVGVSVYERRGGVVIAKPPNNHLWGEIRVQIK